MIRLDMIIVVNTLMLNNKGEYCVEYLASGQLDATSNRSKDSIC